MSSNGTLGGGPPIAQICRNCAEWQIGGRCKFWGRYKYALATACNRFWPREETKRGTIDEGRRTKGDSNA